MPPPMTFEMTIAAASSGPRRRSSAGRTRGDLAAAEEGKTLPCDGLLREQLPGNIQLADLDPLRRAVLGEQVDANVAELAVLEHLGARLGRVAGVTVIRADRQRRGLVAVERDALQEDLFPILFRLRTTRCRKPFEDNVDRKRAKGRVGGFAELAGDTGDELVASVDDPSVRSTGAPQPDETSVSASAQTLAAARSILQF